MNESQSPNKAIIALIIVVLVVAVLAGGYYLMQQSNEQTTTNTVATTDTTSTTSNATNSDDTTASTESEESSTTYADGTYEATGSYSSPGGQEEIEVSVTLDDDVITDATVTSLASNPTSKQYQAAFISGYKSLVVGKSIDDVDLDVVSGSSLTPIGFNNAIEQIKQDATA